MRPTLIDAISTLFMIQRWNFLPRVETWVEAENVAYSAHIGYAMLREYGATDDVITEYLARELLKPLTKHFLSDVSYRLKRALNKSLGKEFGVSAWRDLAIRKSREETTRLFPRNIHSKVKAFFSEATDETIIATSQYVQRRTALQECKVNNVVYPVFYATYISELTDLLNSSRGNAEINSVLDDIYKKLEEVPEGIENIEFKRLPGYFGAIRNLKYLRRWNRTNRSIETSVLGHTYVVTLLALMFSWMHKNDINKNSNPKGDAGAFGLFSISALERALFHDVPEALTGDVITPVKDTIKREYPSMPDLWGNIEQELAVQPILELSGRQSNLAKTIEARKLLDDVSDKEGFTPSSLVKDCDRMALVIECILESLAGKMTQEMSGVYLDYLDELQNSEWHHVREYAAKLAARYR